ncbi:hypothetical protein [Nonlabens marinus]|uniref:Uncharacterized protein n=1 Tax=Nonlabens marinus S1-08 TaxID=1454201 RepID=W8VPP3_9FLAO|nr:hypothetical protein [Nonlabens marinus]BAO55159.1 hypothetical protein NMS_1150 [Nonlabens marinus S1-08]
MKKGHKIMARLLVITASIVGGIFFVQQLNRVGSWQFFAALSGFLIFIGFAVLVFRRTR